MIESAKENTIKECFDEVEKFLKGICDSVLRERERYERFSRPSNYPNKEYWEARPKIIVSGGYAII